MKAVFDKSHFERVYSGTDARSASQINSEIQELKRDLTEAQRKGDKSMVVQIRERIADAEAQLKTAKG